MRENMLVVVCLCLTLSSAHAGQTGIEDYETARHIFWSKIYAQGGETLYCGRRFGSGKGRKINVEHVFPMSWATRVLQCGTRKRCRRESREFNRLEGDMHNLYPALTSINDARGSMRYGQLAGETRRFGRCDFEVDERRRIVEPRESVRGEIARAMFYMRDQYDLTIYRKFGEQLLQWHRQDPPSPIEMRRNDLIDKMQGTRNKYVDNPALADVLRF